LTDSIPAAMRGESSLTRRVAILLAAIVVGHIALAWQVRARGIFTFGDDAAYLLLSRALRAFSYRQYQFIGEPVEARFPPGYPAVLAVLGLFGEHVRLIAGAGIAISASGLIALFDVIRRRWSEEIALLVTAAVAVNPAVVTNAGAIASETVFGSLTLWSLWAADRTDHGESRGLVAGAAAIAAAMTRSAGVTLPLALGAHWLLRRRFRFVTVMAVASAVTVGAWLTWTTFAPKREVRRSYIDDAVAIRSGDGSALGTLMHRVTTNATIYAGQTVPAELQLPVTKRTRLDNVAWLAVLGVFGVTGVLSAWRHWNAAVVFAATYATLLLAWPFTLERFVEPLVPFVIAFVLVGAWKLGRRLTSNRRWAPALPVVMGAILATAALTTDRRLVADALACDRNRVDCAPPASLDYVDAATYAATHTPPDARFVAPKSATFYYFAPRKSTFWDEVIIQSEASFLPYLDRNGVRYLLTTPVYSDHLTLTRLALMHCTQFDLVRALSPETLILVRRATPSELDTPACRALSRASIRATTGPDSGDYRLKSLRPAPLP
jgi:hypothetical protein